MGWQWPDPALPHSPGVSPAEAEPSDPGEWAPPACRFGQPGDEGGSTLEGPAALCFHTRGDPRQRARLRWGGLAPGRALGQPSGPGRARLCCHLLARERVPHAAGPRPTAGKEVRRPQVGPSTTAGEAAPAAAGPGPPLSVGSGARTRHLSPAVRPPKGSGYFRAPLGGSGSGAARAAVVLAPSRWPWSRRGWVRERGIGSVRGCCVPRVAPRPSRPPTGFPGPRRGAPGRGLGVRGPWDRRGTRPRCWAWGGWGGG